ncbi:MAG: translation initiation factor IF-2 [Thermotogota bacterium]
MSKIRIYQLAKRLDMSSKELIAELEELGIKVKNHMSVLDEDDEKLVMDLMDEGSETEEKVSKKTKMPKSDKKENPTKVETKPKKETIKEEVVEKSVKKAPKKEEPEKKEEPKKKEADDEDVVYVNVLSMTLRELAETIKVPINKIIQESFAKGKILNPNQKMEFEECVELAQKYGKRIEIEEGEELLDEKEDDLEKHLKDYYDKIYSERASELENRPPVVTVMGHVDHGKTTLLDHIRSSRVAESEAGGITQAIGAYQVQCKKNNITFIDTPGHEAFTEMRARGAQATDIVILVVAADDGVMPQTEEAYNHAKEAKVPIIVAINKIDKPNANIDLTKQQISSKLHLVPEDWGGDTVTVPISAKTGEGIDDLLEMVGLISEMQDIKCYPKGRARGVIVESELDPKIGPTATCIIKDGTLRIGQYFVCGNTWGKIKALNDAKGQRIKEAQPSDPVSILGFNSVPDSHSILYVVESASTARSVVEKVQEREKANQLKRKHISLEEFYDMVKEGERQSLKILMKADSYGTVEALRNAIGKLQTEEITIEIVHAGIGAITSTDVMLAAASDAVILGFKVKVDQKSKLEAEKEEVQIRSYDIIFDLIEDVKKALQGMLAPEEVAQTVGHGEVKQIFKVRKVGTIAGIVLTDGYVEKHSKVRIYRNGIEVFNGDLDSLKRFQSDTAKVEAPKECGIKLVNFNDITEGDELEFYNINEVERELEFRK